MDDKTLKDLRALVDEVIYSSTKSIAKDPINRLEFMASHIKSDIDGYFATKLDDVVSYAKEASGQSRDKERWINNLNSSWYTFENGVKDDH